MFHPPGKHLHAKIGDWQRAPQRCLCPLFAALGMKGKFGDCVGILIENPASFLDYLCALQIIPCADLEFSFKPGSIIRIRERMFKAEEMRTARRVIQSRGGVAPPGTTP